MALASFQESGETSILVPMGDCLNRDEDAASSSAWVDGTDDLTKVKGSEVTVGAGLVDCTLREVRLSERLR